MMVNYFLIYYQYVLRITKHKVNALLLIIHVGFVAILMWDVYYNIDLRSTHVI